MLGIQRRMAVVDILGSIYAIVYHEVCLIHVCELCEVRCSIEGPSFPGDRRILSTSLPSSRTKHFRCCRRAQSGADTEGVS
jgi:hypothetical protein